MGQVEHEERVQLPTKSSTSAESTNNLEDAFRRVSSQLSVICPIPLPFQPPSPSLSTPFPIPFCRSP